MSANSDGILPRVATFVSFFRRPRQSQNFATETSCSSQDNAIPSLSDLLIQIGEGKVYLTSILYSYLEDKYYGELLEEAEKLSQTSGNELVLEVLKPCSNSFLS